MGWPSAIPSDPNGKEEEMLLLPVLGDLFDLIIIIFLHLAEVPMLPNFKSVGKQLFTKF
jgi:hypothetical protein